MAANPDEVLLNKFKMSTMLLKHGHLASHNVTSQLLISDSSAMLNYGTEPMKRMFRHLRA